MGIDVHPKKKTFLIFIVLMLCLVLGDITIEMICVSIRLASERTSLFYSSKENETMRKFMNKNS